MTISERLEEIQVRYSEWHSDRGDHTPAPNTDTWSDADHPDESMEHCIVRNDVPALVAALRAALDVCEKSELGAYPEPKYDEYIPGQLDTAERVREAITAVLDNN